MLNLYVQQDITKEDLDGNHKIVNLIIGENNIYLTYSQIQDLGLSLQKCIEEINQKIKNMGKSIGGLSLAKVGKGQLSVAE
jgi:hypothetical protein